MQRKNQPTINCTVWRSIDLETEVGPAEHPQSRTGRSRRRESDAIAKEGVLGRVGPGGKQSVDAKRSAGTELGFDLGAEHPEPVQIEKQVQRIDVKQHRCQKPPRFAPPIVKRRS